MTQTDYLIIGSGIAGLTLAIKISDKFENKKITIVTKSNADESNTKYAQGGIAVVQNNLVDNFKKHIEDTILCGDGLCDENVVEHVITEGPKRLQELIDWGAKFDINSDGNFDLGREGGHSENRVVHHKDQTGYEIENTILKEAQRKKNIQILDFHFALELITHQNKCYGAYVLNEETNEIKIFKSQFTILAAGGIGQIYGHTTNPTIATGDGIAMATRAKAKIKDMEFIQFHPTSLYSDTINPSFLISEAVRGFGAILRTKDSNRFMLNYDPRGDLASRDIVSQSIEIELKKSRDSSVFLDCTHLDLKSFIQHFPMIYQKCKEVGINIAKDWIPVIPAQHYLCGGIVVDSNGLTSVENLFACGECSRTGLHGANRLASNSLLEALVYSNIIYTYLTKNAFKNEKFDILIPEWKTNVNEPISAHYILNFKLKLQHLIQNKVGIIRNDLDLLEAKKLLHLWQKELIEIQKKYSLTKSFYELLNMIAVGTLIVEQSISRNENKGGFIKMLHKL